MKLSEQQFYALFPKANKESYSCLSKAMNKYNITGKTRESYFLGQLAHESGGFSRLEENLNYSAQRLVQVFPKYFRHLKVEQYARRPESIANIVYSNRLGNGAVGTGDGWKYRGRGYIQLTGRTNYGVYSTHIGVDLIAHPELAAKPEYAALIAAQFWTNINGNTLADQGRFESLTRRINGGVNGLADRAAWINKIRKYLT